MNGWTSLWPWKKNERFTQRENGQDYFDCYSMPSELVSELVSRPQAGFLVQTINLGTAGVLEVPSPGAAIVIRGHDNSANKTVDTTVLVSMWLEQQSQSTPYPMKHNFGFIGPFSKVILSWEAQKNMSADRYCDVIIYKGLFRPWIDGSAAT